MKNDTGHWIEIESSLDKVEDTVEEILCMVNGNTLPNEKLFGLRLALHEAIGNAIIHGNGNRPDRSVSIRCLRTQDHIEVTVRDEGDGFDYRSIPDPTLEENLFAASGRGIFLMRRLVDEVRFNTKGNEVTLVAETPEESPL